MVMIMLPLSLFSVLVFPSSYSHSLIFIFFWGWCWIWMFTCMTCGGSCYRHMDFYNSQLKSSLRHLDRHRTSHWWNLMFLDHTRRPWWWTLLLWCSFDYRMALPEMSLRIEPSETPLVVLSIQLWLVGPKRYSYKSELMESSKNTTWRLQASEKRWSRCAL